MCTHGAQGIRYTTLVFVQYNHKQPKGRVPYDRLYVESRQQNPICCLLVMKMYTVYALLILGDHAAVVNEARNAILAAADVMSMDTDAYKQLEISLLSLIEQVLLYVNFIFICVIQHDVTYPEPNTIVPPKQSVCVYLLLGDALNTYADIGGARKQHRDELEGVVKNLAPNKDRIHPQKECIRTEEYRRVWTPTTCRLRTTATTGPH